MKRSALAVALLLAATAAGAQSQARATLTSSAGNNIAGNVVFAQEGRKLFVIAEVTGLKPGPHGFHVHEKGDCSAADFSSAGGHFNPDSQPHGNPTIGAHHAGDMPLLVADASGKATARAELRSMTVGGGASDVVGKSVVVHADVDDFRSQPAGNSGARIACGVIK